MSFFDKLIEEVQRPVEDPEEGGCKQGDGENLKNFHKLIGFPHPYTTSVPTGKISCPMFSTG